MNLNCIISEMKENYNRIYNRSVIIMKTGGKKLEEINNAHICCGHDVCSDGSTCIQYLGWQYMETVIIDFTKKNTRNMK